ncbi:MAG: signal peptidase I [Hungatella sp.]|nr:signal peptidase I [Hungatella sp.]
MNILKKAFSFLSTLVLIAIIGFLLIAAPLVAGYKPVMVLSGSMEPAFHVGSIIYYKQAPFADINVGDPLTFYIEEGGAMVTHRVIEKNEETQEFTTQGDANDTADPNPVAYSRVAGKATPFCIPYAGYYVSYGKQMPVIVLMGAILVMNMVIDSLYPDEKDKKSKKSKKQQAEDKNQQ